MVPDGGPGVTSAPVAGGQDTVFNPPPGWAVPAGFDPRRGHLADPAWPPAPVGWQLWVTRPKPRGLLAALKRGWWGPLAGSLAVVVLVVLATVVGSSSSPSDGVGSCWAKGSNGRLTSVDCSSTSAAYRVSAVVGSPAACGSASPGYFEDANGVECLAAIP
jgi:hypothetical protein